MNLSVAMATYNGEKFIRDQLDSILNQTRLPDEIVISDDASTDRTPEILMEYKEKYPKLIKFLLNKENIGFVKNFERAIMNSTGDVVALSDQDDVWLPEKLEKECKILEEHQDIGMVFCDLEVVDEKLKMLVPSLWRTKKWNLDGIMKERVFFETIIDSNRVTGCTIMIRKNVLKKLIPFDKRIFVHDQWLAIGCSILTNVYAFNKPLVLYRQHSSNQIGNIRKKKKISDITSIARKKRNFLEFLADYIENEEIKDKEILLREVCKLKSFWNQRYRLYISRSFIGRIVILISLLLKSKLYKRKISILKDAIFAISPKLEISLENRFFNNGGIK